MQSRWRRKERLTALRVQQMHRRFVIAHNWTRWKACFAAAHQSHQPEVLPDVSRRVRAELTAALHAIGSAHLRLLSDEDRFSELDVAALLNGRCTLSKAEAEPSMPQPEPLRLLAEPRAIASTIVSDRADRTLPRQEYEAHLSSHATTSPADERAAPQYEPLALLPHEPAMRACDGVVRSTPCANGLHFQERLTSFPRRQQLKPPPPPLIAPLSEPRTEVSPLRSQAGLGDRACSLGVAEAHACQTTAGGAQRTLRVEAHACGRIERSQGSAFDVENVQCGTADLNRMPSSVRSFGVHLQHGGALVAQGTPCSQTRATGASKGTRSATDAHQPEPPHAGAATAKLGDDARASARARLGGYRDAYNKRTRSLLKADLR